LKRPANEAVTAFKTRKDLFGPQTGIDTEYIHQISRLLTQFTKTDHPS